jgi:hypothetical protein
VLAKAKMAKPEQSVVRGTFTDIPALWQDVVVAGLVALWLVVLIQVVDTC